MNCCYCMKRNKSYWSKVWNHSLENVWEHSVNPGMECDDCWLMGDETGGSVGDRTDTVGESAPLAEDGSESLSSPQGFHTPVEEDSPPRLLQPPTPTSAILSRSLDGYLEPQRMSFGSPSDFQPSFEDSYPVFSPPPYGAVVRARPPWFSLSTPRQSIISNMSPKSHHTCSVFHHEITALCFASNTFSI